MSVLTDEQRAALTARLRRGRVAADGVVRRDPQTVSLPLSFGQQQLWFIDRFAPGQAMYNIPLAIAVRGELDQAAFGRAVDGLVARHEALRTRLVNGPGGDPVQVIDPPAPVPLPLIELAPTGTAPGGDQLRAFIDAEAVRPFSLAGGPLIRFSLIRLAGDRHVLVVVVHHVVFDGWSAGVLLRDLAALYRAEASGEPSGLAGLPVQFADYALWERGRLAGDVPGDLAGYWREALEGFETVRFPLDRPRPLVEDWAGGLAVRMTGAGLLAELRELGRRHSATLFVTLMAGLQALLHRYTGQDDLVVGTVSANRGRPELAPLVGFLVNTLPIRTDVSGDPSFSELLGRVRRVTTGAYGHQELPFGKMVEVLKVDRDPGRAPIFQISLAYAERDTTPIEAAGVTVAMTDLVAGINAAKFDLSFLAEAREGGLWLECSYKTALFDHDTIDRLLLHLEVLLRGAAANPDARLSELPVLTPAELEAELVTWNDSARQYPLECVHEAFERQVRLTPGAIAAEFAGIVPPGGHSGGQQLSYAQLDGLANRVAARLRELGVGPESLVGVCMPSNLTRLAVFLGIWKAGGGYVPLDHQFPPERLGYLIGDAGMGVVVADRQSGQRLSQRPPQVRVLLLDDPAELPEAAPVPGGATPSNVAYVLYTSGSTGQPKGVVIEHRQAVSFLHAMIDLWQVGPADVVLQFSAFTWDVSVLDTFVPLLAGAKVLLAATGTLHTPRRLIALLRDRAVTVACMTPSAAVVLLGDADLPDLRVLMFGGEALPSELVLRWRRPGLRVVNIYGPAEVTVVSAYAEMTADAELPPGVGFPTPNYQAYVLDAHLNPVPTGVMGELYLGGAGVGRGYLNRPELTRERFIDDPFRPGGRLYKSGDVCFRRRDGSIMFVGRADDQVKLRGMRIEPGEIEAAIAACPGVGQAVVLAIADSLVAYVQPADVDIGSVRVRLARMLPAYMIPAHFVTLAEFPLNASGKVNRSALPAPGALSGGAAPEAPATPAEAAVAELFGAVLSGPIGPTDNYFASGGNSLQVMRLIDLIAERTGADLTPAAVFLHPTPRQLAAHIGTLFSAASASPAGSASPAASASPAGPLVPLSSGTAGLPPLILIHAIGGTITDYTALASELSVTYSVHGLQAPGLSEPSDTPETLGELVARYAAIIRAAFPEGPYHLAGWSMGGVIAYELARMFGRDGSEVGLVALLDAPFSVPADRRSDPEFLTWQFVHDAAQSLGLDELPDTPAGQLFDWLAAAIGGGPELTSQLRNRLEVFSAHYRLLSGYDPAEPVRAPAVIVSASDSPNAPAGTRWHALLNGLVVDVDGDHYSFLRPPAVGAVAKAITAVAARSW
ncbi:MAG TPA: amino acid adenylation domain-containing protein [Streptosporangiaceae bacterium]|nr:amino acid adenylation domain-containing protein [Streptosporangiaceae bacterium]